MLKQNVITLELRHIEIKYTSSSTRTIWLARTKGITQFWTYTTVFSGHHLTDVMQRKGLEIQCALLQNKEPC